MNTWDDDLDFPSPSVVRRTSAAVVIRLAKVPAILKDYQGVLDWFEWCKQNRGVPPHQQTAQPSGYRSVKEVADAHGVSSGFVEGMVEVQAIQKEFERQREKRRAFKAGEIEDDGSVQCAPFKGQKQPVKPWKFVRDTTQYRRVGKRFKDGSEMWTYKEI